MPGYRTFRLRRGLPLFVGLSLLGPHLGAAQEPERTATVEQCLQTIAALDAGAQHPDYVEAMSAINTCPRNGPPAVARWWDRARDLPEAELVRLGYNSSYMRDQRVLDAALRAARDPGRGDEVRLEALATLTSFASEKNEVSREGLRVVQPSWWMPPGLGRCTHCAGVVGPVPLATDARRTILVTFRDLAASDPSPVVRRAALYLRQGMFDGYPDDTPLPAGTITLTYICDNHFRVRNRENVVPLLDYDVYGTTEKNGILGHARKGEEAYGETYFSTVNTGTVRLFHRGVLLQTRANGRKPCNGWTPPPGPLGEIRPFSR